MKLEGYSLIGSGKGEGAGGTWQAKNPKTGEELEVVFHAEDESGLNQAVSLAEEAFKSYGETSSEKRAEFLRAIADEIDAIEEEIVPRMMAESGLPEPRCRGEKGRTVGQLKCLPAWSPKGRGWMRALIWLSPTARLFPSLTCGRCNGLWVRWPSFAPATFPWLSR